MPNYQKIEDNGEEEYRSETPIAKPSTPGTGELNQQQLLRVAGVNVVLKEDKENAVVKNRKELTGVEGGKGICYQWKEKGRCSKGDKCSFWHESNDHAQKPPPKAATASEPSMTRGRSVSRKRSIRGESNYGSILRQPCRYYLKGTCTRSP